MDGSQLSDELARLFRCFGSRPIYVARRPGGKRFRVVRVTIDLESLGGPVTIEVVPESDSKNPSENG
jgi:hypothetical protein